MNRQLIYTAIFFWCLSLCSSLGFAQATVVPSGNDSYVGLEKNMLFNSGSRFQVTQNGSRQFDVSQLFDGLFDTQYKSGFDGMSGNEVVIEIEGLNPQHVQIGAYVGFTTRYYGAKKFKIEAYDIDNNLNTWVLVANETNNIKNTYVKEMPYGKFSKLRFTFYESPISSGVNQGWIGLSELFFLHSEATRAYDGLTVQYSSNGAVGIGTDTPSQQFKLDVNGKIRSSEIKVEIANWPDYVFSGDYSLQSLEEIEKHIKEKGHLPGIPSASEVKVQGLSLGEANARLLEKIEELTLHLIKQDKEIKALKNKIKSN